MWGGPQQTMIAMREVRSPSWPLTSRSRQCDVKRVSRRIE